MLTVIQLEQALRQSWTAATSSTPREWSRRNPACGQCVPTALVVQYYLGGDLQKLTTIFNGRLEAHYRNILADGTVLDFTRQQYPASQELIPVQVDLKGFASIRTKRLQENDTRRRYELLLRTVERCLATY